MYKGDAFLYASVFKSLKTGRSIRLIRQVAYQVGRKSNEIQFYFDWDDTWQKSKWTISAVTVRGCLVMVITQFDQHFGNLTYLRALEILKCLLHPGTLHEKGFSSAWDNWCTRNALGFSNNSLQMLQGYCSLSREERTWNISNP